MSPITLAAMAALHAHVATWKPPARFDHAYAGHMTIERLSPDAIPNACQALLSRVGIAERPDHGCSIHIGRTCRVIIPNRYVGQASPQAILRHERGHCNGWPANHPA